MKDFLLSLVVPKKMERHRNLNIFLVVLLYFLSVALVVGPSVFRTQYFLENHIIKNNLTYHFYDSNYNYLSEEEWTLPQFSLNSNNQVDVSTIVYPTDPDTGGVIRDFSTTFTATDGKIINFRAVYELESGIDKALTVISLADYLNNPPLDGSLNVLMIFTKDLYYYIYNNGRLTYVDDEITESFYLYDSRQATEGWEAFQEVPDTNPREYKYIGDNNPHNLFMSKDERFLVYGAFGYGTTTFTSVNFGDISGNKGNLYNGFFIVILDEATQYVKFTYYLYAFFYTILFSLLWVLATFLMSRRLGEMTRYREYYAIGGISFLAPSVLFGILGIFIPYINIAQYAMLGQVIFFIYCTFAINKIKPVQGKHDDETIDDTPVIETVEVEKAKNDESKIGELD